MAIYEYECTECRERFEVTKPIHEHDELRKSPPPCPKCNATTTHELMPLVGYKKPSS